MTETRGANLQARLDALGIPKSDFAVRSDIDRGTVSRAIADDPTVSDRTWGKIESTLTSLEYELSMTDAGRGMVATVEYNGAKITMKGTPDEVAEAAKKILNESSESVVEQPVGD